MHMLISLFVIVCWELLVLLQFMVLHSNLIIHISCNYSVYLGVYQNEKKYDKAEELYR